ncbi:hypothetical protein [Mucilaginibacter aquaedulcis]|uniref:hypothetical protein n=1 Tax=Mucilaginibacter aquaedulcis TaxID=1187081 RepID=UPI0025B45958|nr:hypothetical protein [Mucilaginibacter aquaedulcis]MDN3551459.1 hypothetical protein [Mucilaginibacter aquaedulcis]
MKVLTISICKIACLIFICYFLSCSKNEAGIVPEKLTPVNAETQTVMPEPIFTAAQHVFTDIQVCYDDKIFLLENGKLKRLIGSELVDVDLPASVYTNFHPTFLTISKDYTFYLRASNGIKIIKGGQEIKFYKVGQPPLQKFTPATFGNLEVGTDETDHSVVFGTVRSGFDSVFFSLSKITKDGHFGDLTYTGSIDDTQQFISTFGIGGNPGTLWDAGLGASSNSFYSELFKSTLNTAPYGYLVSNRYGVAPTNHTSPPGEGPIDSVKFNVLVAIEVSKDGKTLYLKTGEYGTDNPEPGGGISNMGEIMKISDGQVKLIATNVENKRIALSNDGKTLYIAGNGLSKISF